MNRASLGMVSLLLLLLCLPWSAGAVLLLIFGLSPYESDGLCYDGRPVWAAIQALVAIAGLYVAGRGAIGGLATAAQDRKDVGKRWLGIGYGLLAFGAWLLVLFVLEPEGTRIAASNCS